MDFFTSVDRDDNKEEKINVSSSIDFIEDVLFSKLELQQPGMKVERNFSSSSLQNENYVSSLQNEHYDDVNLEDIFSSNIHAQVLREIVGVLSSVQNIRILQHLSAVVGSTASLFKHDGKYLDVRCDLNYYNIIFNIIYYKIM